MYNCLFLVFSLAMFTSCSSVKHYDDCMVKSMNIDSMMSFNAIHTYDDGELDVSYATYININTEQNDPIKIIAEKTLDNSKLNDYYISFVKLNENHSVMQFFYAPNVKTFYDSKKQIFPSTLNDPSVIINVSEIFSDTNYNYWNITKKTIADNKLQIIESNENYIMTISAIPTVDKNESMYNVVLYFGNKMKSISIEYMFITNESSEEAIAEMILNLKRIDRNQLLTHEINDWGFIKLLK